MKVKPSEFLLSKKEELKRLVSELKKDFYYVSVLGTDVTGSAYSVKKSGISAKPSPDTEKGFVVRVFQDIGFSEYSFNHLDVEQAVRKVKEIAKEDRERYVKNNLFLEYPAVPQDEKITKEFFSEVKNLLEEDKPDEIIRKLTEIHSDVMKKHPDLLELQVSLTTTQVNKIFISENKDLYQSYVYSTGYGVAVAGNEHTTKNDFLAVSGLCGSELIEELEEKVYQAAERAKELLHSEKVVPGTYDIICDPDFTGLIAHEAFGHGAEMDMFVKERAKGQEYVNKRVASDKVFMHDGATACEEVSTYLFDDEGNLGKDTLIIDKGILKTGMCDELSALQLGVEPTGNGKRESYKRKAYTRMTNTFFEEGTDSLDEMIASIEYGYLLEGFSSGMEDPKNWGIQCVASKGREIKDGKLTGRIVSPLYLTGYVPELLESITMVSPGLKLSGSGYCGKGWKEWVKTSTGGSYIKAKGRLN